MSKTQTTPKPSASTGPKTRKTSKGVAQRRKTDPTPTPSTRKHAPRGQGYATHAFERKSEDKPCAACGTPYLHAKGLCSVCYNVMRKPAKDGLTGIALIRAIQVKRGLSVTPPTRGRKPKVQPAVAPAATTPERQEVAA